MLAANFVLERIFVPSANFVLGANFVQEGIFVPSAFFFFC